MSSLFHFSLIKILVKFAVDKKKVYWFDFLYSLDLLPQIESSPVKACEEKQEAHETHEICFNQTMKETNEVEENDD